MRAHSHHGAPPVAASSTKRLKTRPFIQESSPAHRGRSFGGVIVRASAAAAQEENVLRKLGLVLKAKAANDLQRLFSGSSKSRERLSGLDEVLSLWRLESSEDTLMDLEDVLMAADLGRPTAVKVLEAVRQSIREGRVKDAADIRAEVKKALVKMLTPEGVGRELQLGDAKPAVILVVGVNGGGKTTSIGKLAHQFQKEGAQVLLAAGDTYRAAAVEQLEGWAARSGAQFHAPSKDGQRPDAVLSQAVDQAKAKGVDVVICDTSGRLHNNSRLMGELPKYRKALARKLPGAPHEVLLVLDGTQGSNMRKQAEEFNEEVGVSGLIVTKLDGTAKGGAVVGVVDGLKIPVKFIGVGETVDDLQYFDSEAFVDAILP